MKRAGLILLLTLGGCAVQPVVDGTTPRSITISYNPNWMSRQEVADMAQAHCSAQGLSAEYVSTGMRPGYLVTDWRCVP